MMEKAVALAMIVRRILLEEPELVCNEGPFFSNLNLLHMI